MIMNLFVLFGKLFGVSDWRKILALAAAIVAIIVAISLTSCSLFQRAGVNGVRVSRSTTTKQRDVVDTLNYGVAFEQTQTITTTRYR